MVLNSGYNQIVFVFTVRTKRQLSTSEWPVKQLLAAMEEELQTLRDQVAQLEADNQRLRTQRTATPGSSVGTSSAPPPPTPSVTDRLVFIPRDRKCPMFMGRTGISVGEWVEEAQACMRARHLAPADQAFFLFDHLEGEAKEEIKFRSSEERGNPARIIAILKELYGCTESYVALQEAFFSRRQQEGETLQEFSLALLGLMEKVKSQAPGDIPNAEALLRDQFIEHVRDGSLRRDLKQYVRRNPGAALLEVRGEAIRWELEGLPASVRGRSNSVPSAFGLQYAMHSSQRTEVTPTQTEVSDIKEMLRKQQEQLDLLTRSVALLQAAPPRSRSPCQGPIICQRCQQPGHIARNCEGVRVNQRSQSPRPIPSRHQQPSEN